MEGSPKVKKATRKPRGIRNPRNPKGKAKGKKQKAEEVYDPRPKHGHFWFTDTGFNILPKHLFHPAIASHLTQIPVNMVNRLKYLEENFPLRDPAPHLPAKTDIDWFKWSKLKSSTIRKAISQIIKTRLLFKKLLHHYRTRRLTPANKEDIYTMEVPKNPVYIVDWKSKQKYTFEAQTLMKDITCRLMTHDGLFDNPQAPRNPYTNIPFTQSQMISVWNSIFSSGIYTSSAFALFRKSNFCLRRFIVENTTFLKLNALSKTMKDPALYDYVDRMIDFISFAYEEESADFRVNMYTYIMRNYPNHPLLKRWAALCYKFYEADILYHSAPALLTAAKDNILDSTVNLIHSENQLSRLYTVSDDLGVTIGEVDMGVLDVYVFLET